MGKKRGKKNGGKNKSPKKPSQAVNSDASQQDPSLAAVEAEAVLDAVATSNDAGTSSTLSETARPSLDAAAHEESFRQSLLNVIGSVEDSADEANADSSKEPEEKVQKVAQDVLEESNDDDKEDLVDDSSANADDITVPHSNSIEHIDGDGDTAGSGDDGLPELPDKPIITTSFGSNSVEDELNHLPDVTTEFMADRRGLSGEDQGAGDDVNDNDEDAVESVESESASQVPSDFTLGGYSNVSKDSAIAALASLGRDQYEGTAGGGFVDGSISPLHLTKGVSAEEGEDTNALPPLDTSVDVSPEISPAGSEEVGDEDDEGRLSINADEELDREINVSLGVIDGGPSPAKLSNLQDAELQPIASMDSTNVEVGDNEGTKYGDKDVPESVNADEKESSAIGTGAAVILGGAGVALGAAAIAGGGEGNGLGAAGKNVSALTAPDVGNDSAESNLINASPGEKESIVANEDSAPEYRGDIPAEDIGSTSSDNALEGGTNIQDNEEIVSDNPFDSFVSEVASTEKNEDSDKEWVSSVLAVGTVRAAVAGGTAALATNNEEVDNLNGGVTDSSISEKPTPTTPGDKSNEENFGRRNKEENERGEKEGDGDGDGEGSDHGENTDKVGPLAVAAGMVGVAAIAGAGAAVTAGSGGNTPDLTTEDDGNMTRETTERFSTTSPAPISKNTSMGSKGSMDSGQYYSHGTFSEDEESHGDGSEEGGERALAAVGAVGTVGIAAAGAGGLQAAPEHTPEEEEFTVISSPSKSLGGESPAKVSEERDIEEGMGIEIPEAGSFAAASSPHGSANDSSPKHSHNKKESPPGSNKKKKLLMAAGAVVLVGGMVGIALALTLGRNDNDKSLPATSSPTPFPIDPRPPTPSTLPNPGTASPTASPIPQRTTPPTEAPQSSIAPNPAPQSGVPTEPPMSEMPTSPFSSKVPTQAPTSQAPTLAPLVESGIPTKTPQSNAPTQPRPTVSPTSVEYAETFQELQTFLGDIVPNPTALENPDSPQYEAASWLASDLVAKGASRRVLQEASSEEITIIQRYALATLWFATGGKRWTLVAQSEDSRWLSPGPECGWEGVICSRQAPVNVRSSSPDNSTRPEDMNSYLRSRRRLQLSSTSNETIAPTAEINTTTVEPTPSPTAAPVEAFMFVVTGLELEESNLNGRIPADLVLLFGLKYLAASNNAITRIPSEMGALHQLERLILNNNGIRGRIPEELGNLSKLIDLRLNDNDFVKKIPSALGNLLLLDSLELHHNELSGTMPDLICSLRYLGEDDVLDRLTSDCASSGDVAAKVECDCCTQCYAGADETRTPAISSTSSPPSIPTASPMVKADATSGTPTTNGLTERNDLDNQNQESAQSLEVEGSVSGMPVTSEQPIGYPEEQGVETREEISGARNVIQRGRDSNDLYELMYEQ